MRKDNSELNQEFAVRRILRGVVRVLLVTALVVGVYSLFVAIFALRASFKP